MKIFFNTTTIIESSILGDSSTQNTSIISSSNIERFKTDSVINKRYELSSADMLDLNLNSLIQEGYQLTFIQINLIDALQKQSSKLYEFQLTLFSQLIGKMSKFELLNITEDANEITNNVRINGINIPIGEKALLNVSLGQKRTSGVIDGNLLFDDNNESILVDSGDAISLS